MKTLLPIFLLFIVNIICAQTDTSQITDGYGNKVMIIYDTTCFKYSHFKHPFGIGSRMDFGNPEYITDRVVLDSNYKMISRKVSNEIGYTYCDWNSKGKKTYEEIRFYNIPFVSRTFFSNMGVSNNGMINTNSTFHEFKYFDDSLCTIELIRFSYNKFDSDSIIRNRHMNIDSNLILNKNYFVCLEVVFYRNGKIKSTINYLKSMHPNIKSGEFGIGSYYKPDGTLKLTD